MARDPNTYSKRGVLRMLPSGMSRLPMRGVKKRASEESPEGVTRATRHEDQNSQGVVMGKTKVSRHEAASLAVSSERRWASLRTSQILQPLDDGRPAMAATQKAPYS